MRFKLNLQLRGDGLHSLPSHYQYELSSWISKTLHFGSEPMKDLLKTKGYLDQQFQFNHFSFSPLAVRDFSHQEDRMLIGDNRISMVLSIIPDPSFESLVPGLFAGLEGRVGDKKSKLEFVVDEVALLPDPPIGDEVALSCTTPLVLIDASNPKKLKFFSPEDKGYDMLFLKNLMAKYAMMMRFFPGNGHVAFPELTDLKFSLIGQPKSRVVKVKTDTPNPLAIKGYLFDFTLKAPAALVRTGYTMGFGENCNLGFGFCEIR
jgi:CRISPR-associated endoribonuclease Cas6